MRRSNIVSNIAGSHFSATVKSLQPFTLANRRSWRICKMLVPLNLYPPPPQFPSPISEPLKYYTFITVSTVSKSFHTAQKKKKKKTPQLCILLGCRGKWIRLLPGVRHGDISHNNLCPSPRPLELRARTHRAGLHKLPLTPPRVCCLWFRALGTYCNCYRWLSANYCACVCPVPLREVL